MNKLELIASKFGTSRASFTAEMNDTGTMVQFLLKGQYRPDVELLLDSDPVERLIASHFSERVSDSKRKMIQTTDLNRVYSSILDDVCSFYEEHSPLKNPTQSKLYKWMNARNYGLNHESCEGFVAIYRYLLTTKAIMLRDQDVINNVLTILEMMREKYEAK